MSSACLMRVTLEPPLASRVRIDLKGIRFGMLVVESLAGHYQHQSYWACKCDCGDSKVISGQALKQGATTSCGCKLRASTRSRMVKHDLSFKVPEYRVWQGMRERCTNPHSIAYKYYGARGISVCARWDDFGLFLKDMGRRPSSEHSIDRIDVNGNYEPGNCRWATRIEQSRNKSTNRLITIGSETLCVAEWADRTGISPQRLDRRLRAGDTGFHLIRPIDPKLSRRPASAGSKDLN